MRLIVTSLLFGSAVALSNGVGKLPKMGYNSTSSRVTLEFIA